MNIAKFKIDIKKCIGCGKCLKVCPGGLISINQERLKKIEYTRLALQRRS